MTATAAVGSELEVLGDLLNLPHRADDIFRLLDASDFYDPQHRRIFAAIERLWGRGYKVDPATVTHEVRQDHPDFDEASLAPVMQAGTGAYRRHAELIVQARVARTLGRIAERTLSVLASEERDPLTLMDDMLAALTRIELPQSLPDGLSTLDAFLDRPAEGRKPWLIPGLLRVGWRVMVVAPEGFGKSVLFRQFAVCAAQGIHPLSFLPLDPVRTLLVDLENPDEAIDDICKPIREHALAAVGERYDAGRAWLWRKPQGIDIRTRTGRGALEAVLEACRPDLVCMGPVYKMYRATAKESDELAAGEAQHVLDEYRTRFGFALMLEHHAPKAAGGGMRDLMPYGSSLWLRWPEQGLKFMPEDESGHVLNVKRWRGDRLPAAWPTQLHRGTTWPWVGRWDDDSWRQPVEDF